MFVNRVLGLTLTILDVGAGSSGFVAESRLLFTDVSAHLDE
jgi:hypothetical protein